MTLAEKLTAAVKSHGVHFTNLFLHDIKNAGQLTEEFLSHLVDDLSKQVPELETPELYDQLLSAIDLAATRKIEKDYREFARRITELSVTNATLREKLDRYERKPIPLRPIDMHDDEQFPGDKEILDAEESGRLKLIK
jgi:flagellar capping protein FliD